MSDTEIVDGSYADRRNAMDKMVRIRVESASDMDRFQRSIEVLKSCNSEFIMRYCNVTATDDALYVVTPWRSDRIDYTRVQLFQITSRNHIIQVFLDK